MPRPRNLWLLALALPLAGGAYWFLSNQPGPDDLLASAHAALAQGDYDQADRLSERLRLHKRLDYSCLIRGKANILTGRSLLESAARTGNKDEAKDLGRRARQLFTSALAIFEEVK